MADVYVVNATTLNVRSKPSVTGTIVDTYTKGKEVSIYKTENGWGNASSSGNKWLSMTYLTKSSSSSSTSSASSSSSSENTADQENLDTVKNDTIYGITDSSYKKLLKRYILAFGAPPRYTKEVDPYYNNTIASKTGRAMATTWYSSPSILSICPGTVDYLPGFSKKKKDQFWNSVKSSMGSSVKSLAKADKNSDLNGKLYSFKSAYTDYINVVNLLARAASNYMGIGSVKNIMDGSNIALDKFDYGYYTSPSKSKSAGKNIFKETLKSLNTAVSDSSYIHFFVNHSGVDASDNLSAQSGKSFLESLLDDESTLSSTAQNIQFLFGGAIGSSAEADINSILEEAGNSSELLAGIGSISKNYLKGGRLVFPQMITGINYEKTIQVQLQFTSIYGDRRSIYKYTILPALHLLALAYPKQLSDNMYTYPYLVRCFEKGNINCDLGFISSLQFRRGGNDNTSWNTGSLPTEITANFTITPLYSNMMVTSAKHPFLFMQNTALMEYLGVMCGLDLKANNLAVKKKLALQALSNRVSDIPTNAARGIGDTKGVNALRNFFQITN